MSNMKCVRFGTNTIWTFISLQFGLTKSVIATYNGIADSVNAYQVTRARQDFGEELFCKLEVETTKGMSDRYDYLRVFKKILKIDY